jgi:hypothetical protein
LPHTTNIKRNENESGVQAEENVGNSKQQKRLNNVKPPKITCKSRSQLPKTEAQIKKQNTLGAKFVLTKGQM